MKKILVILLVALAPHFATAQESQYKDWATIGQEMGYTERNAQYIHGKALLMVKALMEKGEKYVCE